MSENSSAGLLLEVRSADGAEVLTVPVQSSNTEIVAAVAANIRASLRDGFYLDYPEGSNCLLYTSPSPRD